MVNIIIDGGATLQQIRDTCSTTEDLEFCKLVHIKKRLIGGQRKNLAVFVDEEEQTAPLVLVRIPAGANAATIIAEQLAEGRTLIFDERIFVQGDETEVAGFR